MSATWDTIYRDYSDEELTEEREKLKKQLDNFYTSQSVGSKNYARDLQMIQNRMASVAAIRKERGAGGSSGSSFGNSLSGQVDFSQNSLDDF